MKDLRIEKEPERQTQPPQVPDDPAILGVSFPSSVVPLHEAVTPIET